MEMIRSFFRKKVIEKVYRVILIGGIVIFSVGGCSECDPCDVKYLADLVIPTLINLYDAYGQPLLNNWGQQLYGHNELYYNERTGEYFNQEYPPMLGVFVGDIIQMGTRVYNSWSDGECDKGKTAEPTTTSPNLLVSLANGQSGGINLQGMPTPYIPQNNQAWTATKFQFLGPGYYNVDFNANSNRLIDEHNLENNWYYGNDNSYGGGKSSIKDFYWLKVDENVNFKTELKNFDDYAASYNAPETIEDVENLEITKFIKSQNFAKWIEEKERTKTNR